MITPQQQAGKVWENTLPHIRTARKRRKWVKSSLAAGLICSMVAVCSLFLTPENPGTPMVVLEDPLREHAHSIAVMKVGSDGVIRLEECMPGDLGSIELVFGLAPIICNDWEVSSHFP